jgi:hypothetical protein
MPSALDTLISRITDEQLRADIRAAVSDLRKITDFGLVFEAHIPETVPHPAITRKSSADERVIRLNESLRRGASPRVQTSCDPGTSSGS